METTTNNLLEVAYLTVNIVILFLVFLAYRKLSKFHDIFLNWKMGWIQKEYEAPSWQYKFGYSPSGESEYRDQYWSDIGDAGWELVSTQKNSHGYHLIFKRRARIFDYTRQQSQQSPTMR